MPVADNQLERDAAQVNLGERSFFAGVDRIPIDEDDAAASQSPSSRAHIGGAEPDSQQPLVPIDILRPGWRFNELQIELVAWAFKQRSLGQNAEELPARQHREAEQVPVKIDPVAASILVDGLHDAEIMQSGKRRRITLDTRQGYEVDIVDREVAHPIDEVDQAVPYAVNARYVEFHGRGAGRHFPGAEIDRVPIRIARV